MKKLRNILIGLLTAAFLITCCLTAFAETQPTEPYIPPTEVVVTTPVPTETAPDSQPVTGSTDPTDSTSPTEGSEPYTEVTEPVTDFTRPTEYDEDNQPNTYSDYVSPAPIYTPSDQDFEKKEWEEIKIEIKDNQNTGNIGSFDDIKQNTSKGDEKSPLLLILCIVFWCLALSCLTFVILYKPKTAPKPVAEAQKTRHQSRRTDPKVSDDYFDGY